MSKYYLTMPSMGKVCLRLSYLSRVGFVEVVPEIFSFRLADLVPPHYSRRGAAVEQVMATFSQTTLGLTLRHSNSSKSLNCSMIDAN